MSHRPNQELKTILIWYTVKTYELRNIYEYQIKQIIIKVLYSMKMNNYRLGILYNIIGDLVSYFKCYLF